MRSKSWDEFSGPGASPVDFVLTLCDSAAGEACPAWPGRPLTAHWSLPDPAAVTGDAAGRRAAFEATYGLLKRRLSLFVALPFGSLEAESLQRRLDEIGRLP